MDDQKLKTLSKIELRSIICKMLDAYCIECPIMDQLKEEKIGEHQRTQYCLEKCKFQKQIQSVGKFLCDSPIENKQKGAAIY